MNYARKSDSFYRIQAATANSDLRYRVRWICGGEMRRLSIGSVSEKGASVMRITVQYATLIVDSLEESVGFYRDTLGFKEGYHVELGEAGRITLMKSPDGAFVELIESDRFETGFYSIGTDVDNLDEVLSHLAECGVEPTLGPVDTTVGRQAFITDPNGVNICLIQHNHVKLD